MEAFLNSLPSALCQGLIWGIMAIGLYITFKVLNFSDLTVDGSICTGAVVQTILVYSGMNIVLSMIIAFLAGALAGLLTALLHTALGIPSILSGILTQLMLWSINLKILGQANKSLSFRTFKLLINGVTLWKNIIIIIIIIIALIMLLYWFFGTEMGCAIRATGSNESMSKAQGININSKKIIGLCLSNAIIALSGALLAQYQGYADINMGRGAIVIGLASIMIGTSLARLISKNFAFQLVGCVIGAIVYFLIYQIVVFLGFDTDLLKMLSAIIVVIFLAAPYLKNLLEVSKSKRFRKKEAK